MGKCYKHHRSSEFLDFLRVIDNTITEGLDVHIIMDNYATHKTKEVRDWLPVDLTGMFILHRHQPHGLTRLNDGLPNCHVDNCKAGYTDQLSNSKVPSWNLLTLITTIRNRSSGPNRLMISLLR